MVSLKDARYQVLKNLFGPLVTDMLCPTEIVGESNIPSRGPALLVANHRSVMDPYVMTARTKRVVNWVMAPFVSSIPVFGWLAEQAGAISIIKGEEGKAEALIDRMDAVLRQGRLVGIFPEGMDNFKRPVGPMTLSQFHGTFMRVVLRAAIPNLPVIPAAVFSKRDASLGEVKGSMMKLLDPSERAFALPDMKLVGYQEALIVIGKPLRFDEYYDRYIHPTDRDGEDPAQQALVDQLTEQVRGSVANLLERAALLEAPTGGTLPGPVTLLPDHPVGT
ncbi:MAG: phospholipid/glycerol acyltransferase [Cyanobacteria bacterium RYN_339]|nr:phospholipid/glycerol acyltransferase [Cyanobacteria bacterium RYN_339]